MTLAQTADDLVGDDAAELGPLLAQIGAPLAGGVTQGTPAVSLDSA